MNRALLTVFVIALAGCDLQAFLLDTDALPGQREAATEACCECLANSVAIDPTDRCIDEGLDGGPVSYDGGVTRSPCLCSVANAADCSELLLAGGGIAVVGSCASLAGVCGGTCAGVLAYP